MSKETLHIKDVQHAEAHEVAGALELHFYTGETRAETPSLIVHLDEWVAPTLVLKMREVR